jgi:hypothetical protein
MSKKKDNDKLYFSYQKYKRDYDAALKKGRFREGIEKMNFEEYKASYYEHEALAEALKNKGVNIPVHELVLDDAFEVSDRVYKGVQSLLAKNGIKTGLDVIRSKPTAYFAMLKQIYPDPETYDMAISEEIGW